MNLARLIIANPLYGWTLALVCLVGGFHGIQNIGRLENPDFPVKIAYIVTSYPGASAEEVEQEVTDRVEAAAQQLPYVDSITSKSVPGRSEVRVELQEQYGPEDTPQIFDELRRRVREAEMSLPPGTGTPLIEDDFGDVYGILYALSLPDFSAVEIHKITRQLITDLRQVPKVAKVEARGVPREGIFLEFDHTRLARFGLSVQDIGNHIGLENQVVSAGSAMFEGRRLLIARPEPIDSVDALRDMKIGSPGSTAILPLSDLATIKRVPVEAPPELIRVNGQPVVLLSVSVMPEQNVVAVGRTVDERVEVLRQTLPLGASLEPVYRQHQVVSQSITDFLTNLAISVFTVILALNIFMGWRAGTLVGLVLLLTVLGTLEIMYLLGIDLQRISLGALMISMGMLVDNGIVIAEGMVMGVRRGQSPEEAGIKSVSRTQFPLLGATIIGILAFAPISLSDDNSGFFLRSLFQVVAIALLLSWLLAVTLVPLFGRYFLRATPAEDERQLYSAAYFLPYRLLIRFGLRRAWFTAMIILAITVSGLYSITFVETSFFPNNNSPLFYVDYKLQEGTDILTTAEDILALEATLLESEDVESVVSFIGRGSPRFTATMSPEQPNPAYAQLVVRVAELEVLETQMNRARALFAEMRPDAEASITRTEFSPSTGGKIEVRYSGPDIEELRRLGGEALDIYLQHQLIDRRIDWRAQSLELVPGFNESNARRAGISRDDLSRALAYNTHGIQLGMLREDDKLIPIVARAPDAERIDLDGLLGKQVWSATQRQYVPLVQIVGEVRLDAENTAIYRRNRVRTLTAQANPPLGHNVNAWFERVRNDIEAIRLPPGYSWEWGGEHESNRLANEALSVRMPSTFGLMFFITILMFGALRQAIVIWLTVPMVIGGVAIGLLLTGLPLTFPSLLGVLSLSGILIKNCIVLVDEIDKRLAEGPATIDTMLMASQSRLRPVMLAALTTVFGMSPLLSDAFFREMAVCIMSGLMFATLLTLVAVPVFYRIALGRGIRATA